MNRGYIQIKGLSGKINELLYKHFSITSPKVFMLPYSSEMETLVEDIKEILPTVYCIGNMKYDITDLSYIIKNDYLVLTLL